MTSDELIARIEAGETGPELLCAIADIAGWTPKDCSLSMLAVMAERVAAR